MVKKIFSSFILLVSVCRQAVRSHRGGFFTLPCFLWVQGHLYKLRLRVRGSSHCQQGMGLTEGMARPGSLWVLQRPMGISAHCCKRRSVCAGELGWHPQSSAEFGYTPAKLCKAVLCPGCCAWPTFMTFLLSKVSHHRFQRGLESPLGKWVSCSSTR